MPSMTRVLLLVTGLLLLAVTALAALWLGGQLLAGLGAVLTGAAGTLLRLLWFLTLAGLIGGLAYFVGSAWRPGRRVAAFPAARAHPAPATDLSPLVIAAQPEIVTETRGDAADRSS